MYEKIKEIVREIRTKVGTNKAVVFVSGGIDSAVTALVAKKALNKRAVFYFIANGLQRKNEIKRLKSAFKEHGIDVKIVHCAKEFFKKLKNCKEGHAKREAIAELFVKKALEIAKKENTRFLIFGTIKNDLLVCSETTNTIPGYTLIEPLIKYTKKEVVHLAKHLGLTTEKWLRQHFPGVGFAIRIEGNVTKQKIKLLREVTEIVEKKITEFRLYNKLWGYFPFLLETKIDGKYVIVLRIVESEHGLIADIPHLSKELLVELRDEIFNKIPEVGRIYLDLTPKPRTLIELM